MAPMRRSLAGLTVREIRQKREEALIAQKQEAEKRALREAIASSNSDSNANSDINSGSQVDLGVGSLKEFLDLKNCPGISPVKIGYM
jgi:hypothetical protein